MFKLDAVLRSLGVDDYEEETVLRQLFDLQETGRLRLAQMLPAERRKAEEHGLLKAEFKRYTDLVEVLGYDPKVGRVARPRGRPRQESMPDPLPDVGTELLSCLGETYTIKGYGVTPVHSKYAMFTMVMYHVNKEPGLVVRTMANLFAGTLGGKPIVTWPGDSRGLKPGVAVPLGQQRTLTKKDLKADRLMRDEDMRQHEQGKHRRY